MRRVSSPDFTGPPEGAHERSPAYRPTGATCRARPSTRFATDPRRSVVVEACAGAGKTWMLVSRIVRALLDGAAAGDPRHHLRKKAAGGCAIASTNGCAISPPRDGRCSASGTGRAWRRAPKRRPGSRRCRPAAPRARQRPRRGVHLPRLVHVCAILRAPYELLDEIGLDPEGRAAADIADHRSEVMRRFHGALLRAKRAVPTMPSCCAHAAAAGRPSGSRRCWRAASSSSEPIVPACCKTASRPPWPKALRRPCAEVGNAAWRDDLLACRCAARARRRPAADAGAALQQRWISPEPRRASPRCGRRSSPPPARRASSATCRGSMLSTRALETLAARQHQRTNAISSTPAWCASRAMLLAEYAASKRERGLLDMNDLEAWRAGRCCATPACRAGAGSPGRTHPAFMR